MYVRPGIERSSQARDAIDGFEVAGSISVIVGVRLIGESRLTWVETEMNDLAPGEHIQVDGQSASVVVSTAQIHGVVPRDEVRSVELVRGDVEKSRPRESQADRLDEILASFPRPGSNWSNDEVSGIVEAINVKNSTFGIRLASTGESVTIQHLPGRAQRIHGDLPRSPHTENDRRS